MPDQPPTTPRHPSAGNLGDRPAIVREGDPRPSLPPASFPTGTEAGYELVGFGPDIDNEEIDRLLGHLEGKRVLELGCGSGAASIALARRGAKVIAVDNSADRLHQARLAADRAEVKLELHQSDLAELAFVRADSFDAAISIYALAGVLDLGRVFRQVHRVLKPEAPLLLSLPHPFMSLVEPDSDDPLAVTRSYFDQSPLTWRAGAAEGVDYCHSVSEVFTALTRANFRVDTVLEPAPTPSDRRSSHWSDAMLWLPATLVVRGRKMGI